MFHPLKCPSVHLQRVSADVQCVQSIAAVLSHQSQSFPAFSVFLGVYLDAEPWINERDSGIVP